MEGRKIFISSATQKKCWRKLPTYHYNFCRANLLRYKRVKFVARAPPLTRTCTVRTLELVLVYTYAESLTRKMAVSLAVKFVVLLTATSVCAQNESQKDGVVVEEYLERAEKGGIITRVQVQQLKKLAQEMGNIETLAIRPKPLEEEPEAPGVFMRMYNHLTLLNVLYFSGGVLIIGAYTLFMTLAWEMCGGGGISSVMAFQVVLSGTIGVLLWFTEEWQFLGGL